MKIALFNIDEKLAKASHDANCFSDYKTGRQTEAYVDYVDKFGNEVEKLIAEYGLKLDDMSAVEYYADQYSMKLANAINKLNEIKSRVPSVMICGAGNFPVARKEKQNQAYDSCMRENAELFDTTGNYYFRKIKIILTNDTIYSNDKNAIEKLEAKLEYLENHKIKMKNVNEFYKINGTVVGSGYGPESESEALNYMARTYNDNVPYPAYEFTNINAKINNTKKRIEELKQLKAEDNEYPQVDGIQVVEDKEDMRIRLLFDNKPEEEVRNLLKSRGFKWSNKNKAWQRQLTHNGIVATKRVLNELLENIE